MKNHEDGTAAQVNSRDNPEWNMQDVAFAGGQVESPAESSETPETLESDPDAQALQAIRRWSRLYDEEEVDFRSFARQQKQQESGLDTPEAVAKYRTWLLRSEEMAGMAWRQMQRSTNNALTERVISGRYETAQAQNYGRGITPEDTIEAASAAFYSERMKDLTNQLSADADLSESERMEKLRLLGSTWRRVSDYIEATSDFYHGYDGQRHRMAAHNAMIKQLNNLNDLARDYDLQPFTFRNFMTNDFYYDRNQDRGGDLDHIADYDREIVASYFRNVFARDIAREAERQKAKNRLFQ